MYEYSTFNKHKYNLKLSRYFIYGDIFVCKFPTILLEPNKGKCCQLLLFKQTHTSTRTTAQEFAVKPHKIASIHLNLLPGGILVHTMAINPPKTRPTKYWVYEQRRRSAFMFEVDRLFPNSLDSNKSSVVGCKCGGDLVAAFNKGVRCAVRKHLFRIEV